MCAVKVLARSAYRCIQVHAFMYSAHRYTCTSAQALVFQRETHDITAPWLQALHACTHTHTHICTCTSIFSTNHQNYICSDGRCARGKTCANLLSPSFLLSDYYSFLLVSRFCVYLHSSSQNHLITSLPYSINHTPHHIHGHCGDNCCFFCVPSLTHTAVPNSAFSFF